MKKITKIIIKTLEQVKDDIKQLPTKQSLFKNFEKELNRKLNTQVLRQEIINIMLSLTLFREDEKGIISFEYIGEVLQKFETEKRDYTNKVNSNVIDQVFSSQYPKYREDRENQKIQTINSMKPKYIDMLKEKIDNLITEFKKGRYNKEIKKDIQKSNVNDNTWLKSIVIGVVSGVIVLIIGIQLEKISAPKEKEQLKQQNVEEVVFTNQREQEKSE